MAPDYKFYDHFKEILERKIIKYGKEQMRKELLGKRFNKIIWIC